MSKTNRAAVLANIEYLTAAYKAAKTDAARAAILERLYREEAQLR